MTTEQRTKVKFLYGCTFLPGSFPKRFVHDMDSQPNDYELSEKQARYLDVLYYQYREQIMRKNLQHPDLLPFVKPEAG